MRFFILVMAALALGACQQDHKHEPSQLEVVQQKYQRWTDYKNAMGGNYHLVYRNTGFSMDTKSNLLVEVKNGKLTGASYVNGSVTMDDMYDTALMAAKDSQCSLTISYFEDKPVIKSYTVSCQSTPTGIDVIEFFEHKENPN